jgi:hypothetical protein
MGFKSFMIKKALQMKGMSKDQAEAVAKGIDENPELVDSLKSIEANPEIKALLEKIQKEMEALKKTGMAETYAMVTVMRKYQSEITKHREALMPLMQLMNK